MSLNERRANLVHEINKIDDELTLEMLEETLEFYTHNNHHDIIDDLSPQQLQELKGAMDELIAKDTISEEASRKLFARWGTK